MPSVSIAISDILTDPSEPEDLSVLSAEEAEARLKDVYSFLGAGVDLSIREGVATISVADAEPDRAARAERLYSRALKAGAKGEYQRAAALLRDVLRGLPLHAEARRNLAMSYMEAGDGALAKKHLLETLLLNPKDAWAFLILGNLYMRFENEPESAERFYRMGQEADPQDAYLLNSYGALKAKQGEFSEARSLFEEAIRLEPGYPNPRYGLALCLVEERDDEAALQAVERMFAVPESDDPRADPVYEQGRALFLELSQRLAEKKNGEIANWVKEAMDAFSAETGYPIEVERDDSLDVSAASRVAWVHGRDHHVIQYKTAAPGIHPHRVAHEFGHIELAHEARAAGRGKLFVVPHESKERVVRSLGKDARRLRGKGIPEEAVAEFMDQIVTGLALQVYNVPLDMVIERRLHERYEFLRPSQVASLHATQLEYLRVVTERSIRDISPRSIYQANVTMNCAYALFTDLLFNGATNYGDAYRAMGVLSAARRLVGMWQEAMSNFQPGDENGLVDEFASALRLRGWYEWRLDEDADPTAAGGVDGGLEGVTNVELLEEKETAVVALCLSALRRFENMDDAGVLEITSEIALLGRSGLDYASSGHKYTLRALPGERFSGLGLMCLMYVGLQRVDPSVDAGMPFAEAYSRAIEIYRSEKQ